MNIKMQEELTNYLNDNIELSYIIDMFKLDMISELYKNKDKGDIISFRDLNEIITQLEYHKAKLFLAIRNNNKGAIKEYIADCANFLLCLGRLYDIYDINNDITKCYNINNDVDLFKCIDVKENNVGSLK